MKITCILYSKEIDAKICNTCTHWKRYMRLENDNNYCACDGLSSGSNPCSQLYTRFDNKCENWKEWKHNFKKFRDSIKPKLIIGL